MEKREVKVKCSGCGTPIKLKVPVSDTPVSFKCPKCSKALKVRIAPAPAPPPPQPDPPADSFSFGDEPSFEFEQTQFPDDEQFHDTPPPTPEPEQKWEVERADAGSAEPSEPRQAPAEKNPAAIWMFMDEDIIRGPYTDAQVVDLIRKDEIGPTTPMRLGERPWVQAVQVAAFKSLFSSQGLASIKLRSPVEDAAAGAPAGVESIVAPLLDAAPYPIQHVSGQPLAIFAGIAAVLSIALCFDFLIGLVFNIVGWILLYGYLWGFMRQGATAPDAPPPSWNFGAVKDLFIDGAQVFAVLLVFGLLPTGLAVLAVIIGFLNAMALVGYVAMALMIPIFAGCMFILPAALLNLAAGGGVGTAVHPAKLIGAVKSGGQGYVALGLLSIAAGFVCFVGVIAAVFLTEIPDFGFVIAGLVLGPALTYAHFVWFRGIGRFSAPVTFKAAPQLAEA
jgi:hypothetical protein